MKWSVEVVKEVRYQSRFEVDADSWGTARQAAFAMMEDSDLKPSKIHFDSREVIRLGDPWVDSWGWYDLHGPDDIIVLDRAMGNLFTKEDISALKNRIEYLGFKVVESWNGEGCGTVSFKCNGRIDNAKFTKKQLEFLLAPRP